MAGEKPTNAISGYDTKIGARTAQLPDQLGANMVSLSLTHVQARLLRKATEWSGYVLDKEADVCAADIVKTLRAPEPVDPPLYHEVLAGAANRTIQAYDCRKTAESLRGIGDLLDVQLEAQPEPRLMTVGTINMPIVKPGPRYN